MLDTENVRWYENDISISNYVSGNLLSVIWGEPSGEVCTATALASSGGESGV